MVLISSNTPNCAINDSVLPAQIYIVHSIEVAHIQHVCTVHIYDIASSSCTLAPCYSLSIHTVVYNYCLLSQLRKRATIGCGCGHVTMQELNIEMCVCVSGSFCRTYTASIMSTCLKKKWFRKCVCYYGYNLHV